MTHDEAKDKLRRIFAAHRCEDDSLLSDVRALWYADAEAIEAENVRLTARLAKLEAVRAEAVNIVNVHGSSFFGPLRDLLAACDEKPPAPVCKTCDGARGVVTGVEGWPKTIIPCPECQSAPKKEGLDGTA